jgi:Flp pilus assembly pilin Flp
MLCQARVKRYGRSKEKTLIESAVAQHLKLQDAISALLAGLQHEEGQDLIEYSLLAALISIVSIAIMVTLGAQIASIFPPIVDTLKSA